MTLLMESASSVEEKSLFHHDLPLIDIEAEAVHLIERIKRMIRRETNLGVQEMRVSVEDGKVVLSGHCRTFYTKQLAQQAAMKVIGTDELVNDIRVA